MSENLGWIVAIFIALFTAISTYLQSRNIERFKSDLAKDIVKYEIKLKHLHEKRVDAIADLFSKLIEAKLHFNAFASPFSPIFENETDEQKYRAALRDQAWEAIFDFRRSVESGWIFLPKDASNVLKRIKTVLMNSFSDFKVYENFKHRDSSSVIKLYQDVMEKINADIPELEKRLGDMFQQLLDDEEAKTPKRGWLKSLKDTLLGSEK